MLALSIIIRVVYGSRNEVQEKNLKNKKNSCESNLPMQTRSAREHCSINNVGFYK